MTTRSCRVLVVDDDFDHASFVADIAADCGYEAETATNGLTALAMVEAKEFDLVVTDIRMPAIDGMQLIEQLTARRPELAIIAITAFGSAEVAVRASRVGAWDYLSKPFEPAKLAARMQDALARRARVLQSERLRRDVTDLLRRRPGK